VTYDAHKILTSNVTGRHRGPKRKFRAGVAFVQLCLFAGTWRPLVSLITTLYYVVRIIFHRRVWYRALSLRYACIVSSVIILIT